MSERDKATMRDNYEAIELCEVIASGIDQGGFNLQFGSMAGGD